MAIAVTHVGEFKRCIHQAEILDLDEKFAIGVLESRIGEQKNLELTPSRRDGRKQIRVVIGFKTY